MSLTTEPMKVFQVFYSYAPEDERWRRELETQLSSLKREGRISDWNNRKIKAGQERAQEIDTHLNIADIILLLISPDFLASDDCFTEMKRAMERHKAGVARVIPIILRPVNWKGTPFDKLQILPTNAKAVADWPNRDSAFLDIVTGIREAVEDLSKNFGEVAHIKGTQVASSVKSDVEVISPLGTQKFNDEIIDRVKVALDKLHRTYKSEVLPINGMHEFFLTLSMLFVRKTFQEKIRDCEDHNWRGRLRAACLTKRVLGVYMPNVLQFGAPVYGLYEQLLREVDGYTMGLMGLFKLSESHYKLEDIERYIFDAEELKNYLPDQFLRTKIPQKSIIRCDNHLERIEVLVEQLTATDDFDVFLCHHNVDKPAVRKIGEQLKAQGILPWLDAWELQPGLPWQRLLERQITKIKSAAVFIGKDGIGPWEQMELEAFLREFIRRECPVIPVILADASKEPQLPIFLQGMTWVDFRKQDPDPMEQLIWGITGKRSSL